MTFEQAKDQVAKSHKSSCWEWLITDADWDKLDDLHKEVAQIYTIEAIKTDRIRINELYINNSTIQEGISFSCPFDPDTITNLPILL